MQNITGEPSRELVWSINNFSCWNSEIHGKVIMSPASETIPTINVKLYPRGLSGNDAHLVVHITPRDFCNSHGNLSYIGSDGSELCTQQVDSGTYKRVQELPPGPKFDTVVTQIKKNEGLHGDRLILRYQMRSPRNDIEHFQTTIDALNVSLKILYQELKYNPVFKMHSTGVEVIRLVKFPLHGTKMDPIRLIFKKQIGESKKVLTLEYTDFKKKASVFTRVSMLNNEDKVMRTEENEHFFSSRDSWDFCSSLTIEELEERVFSLIFHFKIIHSSRYTHSFCLYRCGPFEMDIMPTDCISRPLETGVSEKNASKSLSTVTSHKPDSSLKVLSSELMCVYQDPDFHLKCLDVSFPVHKNILCAHSPVFKTMLSCDMREAVSNEVDIRDLDPSTLGLFLTYLYTGAVEVLKSDSTVPKLYYAAHKYQVHSLKRECVNFLCNNVSVSNVGDILSLANRQQDDRLIGVAKEFILNNFNDVLASAEWKRFMRREPLLAVETLTHFGEKKYVRESDAS